MTSTNEIILLTAERARQAGDVLGRAFADDPLMSFWLPEAERRHKYVPRVMYYVTRYCLQYDTVETTSQAEGVAFWLPPGEENYHYAFFFRTGWILIPFQTGLRNYARMLANDNIAHIFRKNACPGPHWYLWALGVEPALQSQGIGGRLLATGLERADAQGMPCYLDINNPNNIPFYQQYGFEVTEESNLPGYDFRIWGMRQPARS
jgi:ribosomal protein S18 acetylase RimI-like enzyme